MSADGLVCHAMAELRRCVTDDQRAGVLRRLVKQAQEWEVSADEWERRACELLDILDGYCASDEVYDRLTTAVDQAVRLLRDQETEQSDRLVRYGREIIIIEGREDDG